MFPLLVAILGSILFGFFLIFLLALSDKKQKEKRWKERRERGADIAPERLQISQESFEKACTLIVEGMKLDIEEINRSTANAIDIMARNPLPIVGGPLIVHCLYIDPDECVSAAQVLELSQMIIQDRLLKGVFMTTGKFAEEIATLSELAVIELIDGKGVLELIRKHAPEYVPAYMG